MHLPDNVNTIDLDVPACLSYAWLCFPFHIFGCVSVCQRTVMESHHLLDMKNLESNSAWCPWKPSRMSGVANDSRRSTYRFGCHHFIDGSVHLPSHLLNILDMFQSQPYRQLPYLPKHVITRITTYTNMIYDKYTYIYIYIIHTMYFETQIYILMNIR